MRSRTLHLLRRLVQKREKQKLQLLSLPSFHHQSCCLWLSLLILQHLMSPQWLLSRLLSIIRYHSWGMFFANCDLPCVLKTVLCYFYLFLLQGFIVTSPQLTSPSLIASLGSHYPTGTSFAILPGKEIKVISNSQEFILLAIKVSIMTCFVFQLVNSGLPQCYLELSTGLRFNRSATTLWLYLMFRVLLCIHLSPIKKNLNTPSYKHLKLLLWLQLASVLERVIFNSVIFLFSLTCNLIRKSNLLCCAFFFSYTDQNVAKRELQQNQTDGETKKMKLDLRTFEFSHSIYHRKTILGQCQRLTVVMTL